MSPLPLHACHTSLHTDAGAASATADLAEQAVATDNTADWSQSQTETSLPGTTLAEAAFADKVDAAECLSTPAETATAPEGLSTDGNPDATAEAESSVNHDVVRSAPGQPAGATDITGHPNHPVDHPNHPVGHPNHPVEPQLMTLEQQALLVKGSNLIKDVQQV